MIQVIDEENLSCIAVPMGERVAGRLFNNEGALFSPADEGIYMPTLTFRNSHLLCTKC